MARIGFIGLGNMGLPMVRNLLGAGHRVMAFDVVRSALDAAAAAGGAVVVLDLTAVTFLDSTALGTIVGLLRRMRESGGSLRVVLPETEARRIFELTGLERSLDVRASRETALS